MASGFSKRMGKNKLLIEIDGIPILERVIRAAIGSKLHEIILIYRESQVKEMGDKYGIKTIENLKAHLGQAEGMKLGIESTSDTDAYMFLVGDQPFLTKDLINQLLDKFDRIEAPIVVPYYGDKRGMPILMSSEFRDDLLEVQGDKGGREIVEKNLHRVHRLQVNDYLLYLDMDTEEDLKRILKKDS